MRIRILAIVTVLLVTVAILAVGCGGKKEADEPDAKEKVTGAVELDTGKEILFPVDHYPHEGMGTEWWYFTGVLNNQEGEKFGYFYTYFLNDGETLILMSIVDLRSGTKVFEEFIDALGEADVPEDRLDIDIGGDWQVRLLDNGDFHIKGTGENVSLELTLHPEKDNVINGDGGYMEMSSGGTSAYYSCTRMSADGRMSLEGREMNVTGDSWLDRQWGNWKGEAAETYDWFSLRFDDNTELMLYSFRDTETGEVLPGYNCGTYVDENGKPTNVTDFTVEPLDRRWRSDKTGETYPLKWRVSVPQVGIDITIDALVEDQLIVDSFGGTFWEGVCGVVEGNKTGYGYVEMDGYNP